MEDFSKRLFGEEDEKDSDEESRLEKEKSKTARKIGAFAKQKTTSNLRSDTDERHRWFASKEDDEEEDQEREQKKAAKKPKKIEDTKEDHEESPPPPEVIEEAKRETAIEHIDTELEALDNESSGSSSDQEAGSDAIRNFLSAVKERLQSGEKSVDPIIEAEAERRLEVAEQEVIAKQAEEMPHADIITEDYSIPRFGEIPLDTAVSPEGEAPAIIPLEVTPTATTEGAPAERRPDEADETTPPSTATTPLIPVVPSSPTARPFSSGAGGGIPPTARTETHASIPPPEQPKETAQTKKHPSRAGASLLVGYMIGRRGGRKRTEARLTPKINNLEQEKLATERLLEAKERELQRVTLAVQERTKQPIPERPAPERQQSSPDAIPQRTSKEIVRQAVLLPEHLQAATASLEKTPPSPVEGVLISPEKKQDTPEKLAATIEKIAPPALATKKVEQLSTPELIKEAEHLYIDGASIRTLYNANRIDRAGLIKIVQESIRGGDINTVFKQVEIGRERQRERAKEFRHDDSHTATSSGATPAAPPQRVGHLMMQDVRPPQQQPSHPRLHIPENEGSPDLDATHQEPTSSHSKTKLALTITAALAIFFAVAIAIVMFR